MVDLKQQYAKIKTEVDAALNEVLGSAAFIHGPAVETFSRRLAQYLEVGHVIPCANGTDALQIALMSLNLQPGDEVITPSFTYVATTEVIALLRLQPVFVEVDPRTFNIDPGAVERAVTSKTKAIIPVHLYGQSADMHAIMEVAARNNLIVIEDNAQAIGASYTFPDGRTEKTGTIGTIGTTSFFPSKNLGAYGDGGAMFTRNDELAGVLRKIANHGQQKRYYHDMVGCNSRLDSLQAAVLNVKLKYLDDYIRARVGVADYYDKAFKGHPRITTPYRAPYSTHVFHQYTIILDGVDRDDMHAWLAERSVPSMIYYPVPAHRQKMFRAFGGDSFQLDTTDWLTERVLSLPIHTEMDEEQLAHITRNVLEYLESKHP